MNDISFEFVWRQNRGDIEEGVRKLWSSVGLLPSKAAASDRLRELCAVTSIQGKIVATSTVKIVDSTFLHERLAYYRTFVAREWRQKKLAQRLCVFTRDKLALWARENPDEKLKGLLIVLQAKEFAEMDRAPVARLPGLDFVFVGYNQAHERIRVIWFDDAKLE